MAGGVVGVSEKVIYLCDAGPPNQPCRKETKGFYILTASGSREPVRHDLCEYHTHAVFATLRGQLVLPRDPAEAACP
jgi:hypothetical protein